MPKNLPSASIAIGNLQDVMFADLDQVGGGCSWWHGYQDWPRLVVINDYLLQTVGTLTNTTLLMAHHLQRFEERWTSEDYNVRRRLKDTGTALGQRSPLDEVRSLDIQVAVRGFFDTAAHTLDLVATLIVGICALKEDLKKAGWTKVIPRARNSLGQRQSRLLDDYGTDGRRQQEAAICECISSTPSQPEGWIEWTLHTRHTFLHRAGRMILQVVSSREDKRHLDSELFYFLPVHPRLSDAEVMGQSQTMEAAYLPNHAADLIRMIHSNTVELVAVYCRVLEEVWIKRRDNPLLLVQPGQQWQMIEGPTQPAFAGASQKVRWPGGTITINPRDAERWEAAKVMDTDAKKHWGTHR